MAWSGVGWRMPGRWPMSLLARDKALRELLTRLQTSQARRNDASKLIGQAKQKKDEALAKSLLEEVAGLKDDIQKGEAQQRELEEALKQALAVIPNIPADDVPDGADEKANVPVAARAFGKPPGINDPRQHFEIGEALGQMDFERAAKVSGARFVYLKGDLAQAGTRVGRLHAGHPHREIWLYRSLAAGAGAQPGDVRHRPTAEIPRMICFQRPPKVNSPSERPEDRVLIACG